MPYLSSPIPQISISPAPPEDPRSESDSPLHPLASLTHDYDGFRPVHLTPPPTATNFKRPLSPLNNASGKGLEGQRFQALLKATKERNASIGAKKGVDLRKEIAFKVHKNKQVERRALFLSKVQAPPSPTAAITPKTPPDSPAIFHYSLPSPGLVSPLALFESLNENRDSVAESWVEQVDFRLPGEPKFMNAKPKPSHGLPSLDQISARMIPRTAKQSDAEFDCMTPVHTAVPRLSFGVGRLKMPLRTQPVAVVNPRPKPALPPKSPLLYNSPELRVTTLVVPRSNTTSPVKLTEINLNALNSRDQRAHNMLSTLRRRASSFECKFSVPVESHQYMSRRRSAAADLMPCRARTGFEHPILALPGGF